MGGTCEVDENAIEGWATAESSSAAYGAGRDRMLEPAIARCVRAVKGGSDVPAFHDGFAYFAGAGASPVTGLAMSRTGRVAFAVFAAIGSPPR